MFVLFLLYIFHIKRKSLMIDKVGNQSNLLQQPRPMGEDQSQSPLEFKAG